MGFRASQRVVFVTGKGGVGKSTVAAALAELESRRQARVALVEFDDNDGAQRALGSAAGVELHHVEHMSALTQTLASMIGSRRVARLVLRQRALRRVVRAVPAVRELIALEAVRAIAEAVAPGRVIVDLPATGHALDWLRVPAAAERFLRRGPAAKVSRKVREQVVDPARCAVVVVSTVEPVVASETRALCHRLKTELKRDPELLVFNRVPREVSEATALAARSMAASDPRLQAIALLAQRDAELHAEAQQAYREIGDDVAQVRLPMFARDPSVSQVADLLESPR